MFVVRAPRAPRRPLPPGLLQRPLVSLLERALDLRAAMRELADDLAAALCAAGAANAAVEPRELELHALHVEHRGHGELAPGLHDELGEDARELGVLLVDRGHRFDEAPAAEVHRGTPQALAGEMLVGVERLQRPRAVLGRGDAEREEGSFGVLASRERARRARRGAVLATTCADAAAPIAGAALATAVRFTTTGRPRGGARATTGPGGLREQRLGEAPGQVEAPGDQACELHSHRAGRERGEDGTQLIDHAVASLGTGVVAGGEHAFDAKAHERHRRADRPLDGLDAL